MSSSNAIEKHVNLQAYNTLRLAVEAAYFIKIKHPNDLYSAWDFCQQKAIPWLVLGGGSNLVLTQDFAGLVMLMDRQGYALVDDSPWPIKQDHNLCLEVMAGQDWDALVDETLQQGWYGLQNLSLIPGTTGAAPIQNIGAYGAELKDYLLGVEVFDFNQRQFRLLNLAECQLSYRHSLFKQHKHWIITKVYLALSTLPKIDISYPAVVNELSKTYQNPSACHPKQVREAIIAIRQSKLPDPKQVPNVGSFFKNPIISQTHYDHLQQDYPSLPGYALSSAESASYQVTNGQSAEDSDEFIKLPAAWLIETLGWKGHMHQGVGMHKDQALVLVIEPSQHKVTGQAILALAQDIQKEVKHHFGITLEIEPSVYDASGMLIVA